MIISSIAIAVTIMNLLYPTAQIFPIISGHISIWLTIMLGPMALVAMAVAGWWLTIHRQKVNNKDLIIVSAGFAVIMALPWMLSYMLESSFALHNGASSLLLNFYTVIVNFSFGLVGVFISYIALRAINSRKKFTADNATNTDKNVELTAGADYLRRPAVIISSIAVSFTSYFILSPFINKLLAVFSFAHIWRLFIGTALFAMATMALTAAWLIINNQQTGLMDQLIIAAGLAAVIVIPGTVGIYINIIKSSPSLPWNGLILNNIYSALVLFIFGFITLFIASKKLKPAI